VCG
jgi:hypothetical protein